MAEQHLAPIESGSGSKLAGSIELRADSPLLSKPNILPPLDQDFRPFVVGNRAYAKLAAAAPGKERVVLAVERENGLVARREMDVLPLGGRFDDATLMLVERTAKFMLWANGGWKIQISGPERIGHSIAEAYSRQGSRAFDADLMSRVYEHERFQVELVSPEKMAAKRNNPVALGGHLNGCRIGFDLGASDYKVCAVNNGQVLYTEEFPWDPKNHKDPDYHESHIRRALQAAAQHLPRVDAIGGSSAGVIVDNRVRVASLFRAVPTEQFNTRVVDMFVRLGQEFGVPLQVINDGDVTALAGGMSLKRNAMLGIAMGSSQAAGYLDPDGKITGWLNELAFAPVDYNPRAARDEWSGDRGVGANYFSQQAVDRLLAAARIILPQGMDLPTKLTEVQQLANAGHEGALDIARTIGVYLGYTLAHYAEHYDFKNVLVLGRVTSGKMGEMIIDQAHGVLKHEYPELSAQISVRVPDEKSKRVGQAVAAASLPELK